MWFCMDCDEVLQLILSTWKNVHHPSRCVSTAVIWLWVPVFVIALLTQMHVSVHLIRVLQGGTILLSYTSSHCVSIVLYCTKYSPNFNLNRCAH